MSGIGASDADKIKRQPDSLIILTKRERQPGMMLSCLFEFTGYPGIVPLAQYAGGAWLVQETSRFWARKQQHREGQRSLCPSWAD
jgi:hypothetical protein